MKQLLLPLALAALSACSSGDSAPRPGEEQTPPALEPKTLPECPSFDYTPCDILELDCQAHLRALAACVYGREPALGVSIELMDEQAYQQLLIEDWADIPEEQDAHLYRALSMLKLSSGGLSSRADSATELAARLGGVYRADEQRIIIIDHGEPADTADSNAVLVHELVHSMQDASYDFETWPRGIDETTFDGFLATRTVVEGEATFFQHRVAVPMLGLDIDDVDFRGTMRDALLRRASSALLSPTPYSSSFSTFTYGFGAHQAYEAWRLKGADGLAELWETPPATTQQVYAKLFSAPEQTTGIEIAEPAVSGLVLDTQDVLGAWGIELFLFANDLTEKLDELPVAWRGDRFWVYTDEAGGATYGLWQLELDTAANAAQLDESFAVLGSAVAHEASGKRVFVSFGFENGAIFVSNRASPELTAWGKAWLAP